MNDPFPREDIEEDGDYQIDGDLQNNENDLIPHQPEDEVQHEVPEKAPLHPAAKFQGVPVRKFLADLSKDVGNQVSNQDENTEVLKWKKINIVIIALTTFLTIIFLQILA